MGIAKKSQTKRILLCTLLILCFMLAPAAGSVSDAYAASASSIVSKAKAQNQKKISSFPGYFHSGAWCVDFVWWCADKTNLTNGKVFPSSLISNTRSMATWFTQKGKYTSLISPSASGDGYIRTNAGGSTKKSAYNPSYKPKTGDIAFFRSSGKSFQHTAIVMSFNSGTDKVKVVHGNWNASSNPRVVAGTNIKARKYDSSNRTEIVGYARPAYSSSSSHSGSSSSKSTISTSSSSSSNKATSSDSSTSSNSKYTQGKVTTKTTPLNVRIGAGLKYKRIGSLNKGKTIALKGSKGNWYKIAYNGKTGYICKSYVTKISTKKNGTVKITSGTLNMRTGPGTTYKIIKSLKKGAKLKITATKGNWYKVKYSGKNGFVCKNYIK